MRAVGPGKQERAKAVGRQNSNSDSKKDSVQREQNHSCSQKVNQTHPINPAPVGAINELPLQTSSLPISPQETDNHWN
ncbi:hypothetical protein [[Phormidium] sp. ETS-05]|uniref:hypothetical protein n=1 Tax=[Phormidium] sp. ETS-05 TaxID=222819 RepID=UPI0018EECE31|nr:hypothetical protein [[Phormidium] sp. ETS-05]